MRLFDALRDRPRRVSVRLAWREHERYTGRRITTQGVVRVFEVGSRREYFALDDGPHRIGLRGDAGQVRPLLDQPVQVTGRLTFRRGAGIFLELEAIAPSVTATACARPA